MSGHGGFFGGFMWVWWLVPIVLVVLLVALAGGSSSGGRKGDETAHGRESGNDKALEILRQRLARGEIDSDEYERLKQELES